MAYVTTRAIDRIVELLGLDICRRITDGELPKRCAACGDVTLGPCPAPESDD